MLNKIWNNTILWEVVGYITLAMCIVGQITVGYWYIPAQLLYLTANVACVIRDYALKLPTANKIKDIVFTAITIGLIIIFLIQE